MKNVDKLSSMLTEKDNADKEVLVLRCEEMKVILLFMVVLMFHFDSFKK